MPIHNTGIRRVGVGVGVSNHQSYGDPKESSPGKTDKERQNNERESIIRFWRTGRYAPSKNGAGPKPFAPPLKTPAKENSTKTIAGRRAGIDLDLGLGESVVDTFEDPNWSNPGKTDEERDYYERERIMYFMRRGGQVPPSREPVSKPDQLVSSEQPPQKADKPKRSTRPKYTPPLPKRLQNRSDSRKPKLLPGEDRDERAAQDVLDKETVKKIQETEPVIENLPTDTEVSKVRVRMLGRKRTAPIFGEAPRHPLSKEERWEIMRTAEKYDRETKGKGQKEGAISLRGLQILRELFDILGAEGQVFPSYKWLMEKTGFCKQTVNRCLARLERAGIVKVYNRMKREVVEAISSTTGEIVEKMRVVQTSNAYTMHMPKTLNYKIEDPVEPRPFPSPRPLPPALEFLAGSDPITKACAQVFRKIGAVASLLNSE